jgi:hypothetical protein
VSEDVDNEGKVMLAYANAQATGEDSNRIEKLRPGKSACFVYS